MYFKNNRMSPTKIIVLSWLPLSNNWRFSQRWEWICCLLVYYAAESSETSTLMCQTIVSTTDAVLFWTRLCFPAFVSHMCLPESLMRGVEAYVHVFSTYSRRGTWMLGQSCDVRRKMATVSRVAQEQENQWWQWSIMGNLTAEKD